MESNFNSAQEKFDCIMKNQDQESRDSKSPTPEGSQLPRGPQPVFPGGHNKPPLPGGGSGPQPVFPGGHNKPPLPGGGSGPQPLFPGGQNKPSLPGGPQPLFPGGQQLGMNSNSRRLNKEGQEDMEMPEEYQEYADSFNEPQGNQKQNIDNE